MILSSLCWWLGLISWELTWVILNHSHGAAKAKPIFREKLALLGSPKRSKNETTAF
jgi:hypothetical protein